MGQVEFAAAIVLAGLTAGGSIGSIMEAVAGRRLSFGAPFISREHLLRSLLATVFAGPFMLVNDALEAWRTGSVSLVAVASCLATACVWTAALGLVVVDVASGTASLLHSG